MRGKHLSQRVRWTSVTTPSDTRLMSTAIA
jgi:hypothetical protein